MNPTRDIQLDIYRALAMIYIPCVIHAAYWLNLLPEPLLSIILFEMPVVFFISGASLSGRPSKTFKDTFVSRFKRVLLPYYIYFTIYIVFVAVAAYLDPNLGFTTSIFKGYIIPKDCGYLYCWHLWFIIPYMSISISFPFQCDLINRLKWKYLLMNLILMGIVIAFKANIIIREIVCFNIFFVAGYLYYRKVSVKRLTLIACCGILGIIGVLMLTETSFTPMQLHKFPPDFVFIIFGFIMLCFLGLIFSRIKLKQNRIFDIWNKRGYTIYLYQNFLFVVIGFMLDKFSILSTLPGWAQFVISMTLIFLLATLLSYPLSYIERKCTTAIIYTYNYLKLKALPSGH